ncbi:UNVERIFIED_ORG: metal-dependent amidase/aminoacylase/carboxypeptidase family protein [Ensifer adhaerens]|nr:metal-dependent amidase/aminoacylase/carboxypeptidase family protein [Ensifer adhaerens]
MASGTAHGYLRDVRDTVERRLWELAEGLATTHGCTARIDHQRRYPPLINHPEQTKTVIAPAERIGGSQKIDANITPLTNGLPLGVTNFARGIPSR